MKKIFSFLSFFLFILVNAIAQDAVSDTISDVKVKKVVEQMPKYVGGNDALFAYLNDNIQYPTEAAKKKIQGRVIIQFIVTKEGKVKNAKVVRSLNPLCDAEALRVVRNMPDWIPGVQNG